MKIIKHIRRWNIWRKRNMNGPVYKLLVLFGLVKSSTMARVLLPEEIDWVLKGFEDGLKDGLKGGKKESRRADTTNQCTQ